MKRQERIFPGYLEAVYHLYSMTHKHGPVVVRMRTPDRADGASLPSLTARLAERGISGARNLRSLRYPLRGPSRSATDFDVG